jgi:putative flippase GtrA
VGLVDVVTRLKVELAKFGAIGAISYVIDVGIFNGLRFPEDHALLNDKPLTAKAISVAVATTFAYFGNRFWTFKHRARTSFKREYSLFFALNGVAMGIALFCLWLSHYVLGLQTPLADNISANVIGLVLGTVFRFWGYQKWVFLEHPQTSDTDSQSP